MYRIKLQLHKDSKSMHTSMSSNGEVTLVSGEFFEQIYSKEDAEALQKELSKDKAFDKVRIEKI